MAALDTDPPVILAIRLAAGDLAPDVLAWLEHGMRRWLAGGNLDRALRLDRASRVRQRNAALHETANLLDDAELAPWALAGRLQDAIERFEALHWPACRDRVGIPALGQIDSALYRAFAAGAGMIREQRGLYERLLKTEQKTSRAQ